MINDTCLRVRELPSFSPFSFSSFFLSLSLSLFGSSLSKTRDPQPSTPISQINGLVQWTHVRPYIQTAFKWIKRDVIKIAITSRVPPNTRHVVDKLMARRFDLFQYQYPVFIVISRWLIRHKGNNFQNKTPPVRYKGLAWVQIDLKTH